MIDRESVERLVKLIAATAAFVSLIAWSVLLVMERTPSRVAAVLTSAIATLVYGIAWRIPRVPAMTIVVTSILLTGAAAATVPDTGTKAAAAVTLVAVAVIGVAIVRGSRVRYIVATSLVLLVFPALFEGISIDTFIIGMALAISTALGGSVTAAVLDRNQRSHDHYQRLFDETPVAITHQDWTNAVGMIRALDIDETDALETWLTDHPDFLRAACGTVTIISANDKAVAIKGSRPGDQALSPDRIHAESLRAIAARAAAIATGRDHPGIEYRTTSVAGEWVTARVRTVMLDDGPELTTVLVFVEDLTEEIAIRAALQDSLDSKDEFIASISHELRTPLAAVVGMTATVLDEDTLDAHDREMIEIAREQAQEMAHIIEDLLVAARADAQTLTVIPQEVRLQEAARHVARGQDIEVTGDDPVVWADPLRIRQVIRNLVTNAQRYGTPPIGMHIEQHDGSATVAVTDHGDAIPDHKRARMFEPYERAEPRSGITASVGLGLAVSRTLATLMGGSLDYTHDGDRSVFRLTVPTRDLSEVPAHAGGPQPTR